MQRRTVSGQEGSVERRTLPGRRRLLVGPLRLILAMAAFLALLAHAGLAGAATVPGAPYWLRLPRNTSMRRKPMTMTQMPIRQPRDRKSTRLNSSH